ncbi:MAG TPA: hypothetical protein VF510_04610 [Ktedonobacterales bacterium]
MKKWEAEIRALFQPFFVETRRAFQFLEHTYGYQHVGEEVSTSHPRDWAGMSRYVRSRVGVEIGWEYAESSIGVSFVALHQPGIFQRGIYHPDASPDRPRAISLYSLAYMLGHGDDPDFLLPTSPDPPDDMSARDLSPRARRRALNSWQSAVLSTIKRRRQLIETNMPGVLAGLARATQTYASAILEGDTSVFPSVLDYALAELRRHYPTVHLS